MAAAQLAASIKQELMDTCETTPMGQGPSGISEPVNLVDLEERILQLCVESPKGISDYVISQDQPLVDTERRRIALNRLLSQVFNMHDL